MDEIKERLITAPVLAHPDYEKPFLVQTDAFTTGHGVILAQRDNEKRERPIVYLSRTLSPAEKIYSSTDLECLGIIWALRKLHPYLDGATFEIITDHSALQWILSFSGTNKRLLRWSLDLQPYREHMIIKYKAGRVHQNVDTLSRAPLAITNHTSHVIVDDEFKNTAKTAYAEDAELTKIIQGLGCEPIAPHLQRFRLDDDGLLWFQSSNDAHPHMCIPKHKGLRLLLLHDFHDAKSSGHLGYEKTLDNLSNRYFWNNMSKDARQYCQTCSSCQRSKIRSSKGPTGMLNPLDIPPQRWHTVTMDFAGPLALSGEGDWDMIMVVVDKLTKRVHFVPCKSTDQASDTAERFFDAVVKLHGMPRVIVSDRDAKFTSLFWKTLMARFDTKLAMSTAPHPQTDGQSEIMVRTVKEMLRHYISPSQKDWATMLPVLEFAFNNSVNASTGMTPFEFDLGYRPVTPHTVTADVEVESVEKFIERQNTLLRIAQDCISKAQIAQAVQHNKGRTADEFEEDDMVLLATKHVNPPFLRGTGSKKLRAQYIGPYRIAHKISSTAYELDLPATVKIHPVVNVQYLKAYRESPAKFSGRVEPPPPPVMIDGEEYFEVEEILSHRSRKDGKRDYKVKWLDYGLEDCTWEAEENQRKP